MFYIISTRNSWRTEYRELEICYIFRRKSLLKIVSDSCFYCCILCSEHSLPSRDRSKRQIALRKMNWKKARDLLLQYPHVCWECQLGLTLCRCVDLALNLDWCAFYERFFLPVIWLIDAGRFTWGVSGKSASILGAWGDTMSHLPHSQSQLTQIWSWDCAKNLIWKEHFGEKNPPTYL